MLAIGESKRDAATTGEDREKIFSYSTYKTYMQQTKNFVTWLQQTHPEATSLKRSRKYVNEYLQMRVDRKDSAYTIHTAAAALRKVYGIAPGDKDFFDCPKRERANIVRSRVETQWDKHFSWERNADLVNFCRGTGLRRMELGNLEGRDLRTKDQIENEIAKLEKIPAWNRDKATNLQLSLLRATRNYTETYFVHVRCGKGGRERYAPIIGKHQEEIVERIRDTKALDKVWPHINTHADVHSFRSDYATALYREYARDISKIPYDKVNKGTGHKYQSEVYYCRKDQARRRLDKRAMKVASQALGHNRLQIIATNYLRD